MTKTNKPELASLQYLQDINNILSKYINSNYVNNIESNTLIELDIRAILVLIEQYGNERAKEATTDILDEFVL